MNVIRTGGSAFVQLWHDLDAADGLRIPLYSPRNIEYYSTYFGHKFEDHSFVLAVGNDPAAGLRITSHPASGGGRVLSCFGLPTYYITRPGLPAQRRRDASAAMKGEIKNILERGPAQLLHLDFLRDGAVCDFSRQLLQLGARATPVYAQVIDLSRSEEQLHSEMSKSFRWNVNWGLKNLTMRITGSESQQAAARDLELLRLLHVEAAGRSTRSLESWNAQLRMLLAGEAFIVLAELGCLPVSAALFPVTPSYCFYGVSASKREFFDKPISHAVLWTALVHAKYSGCRWFETGEQRFPGVEASAATTKELGISSFKRNFGGMTQVRLKLELSHPATP